MYGEERPLWQRYEEACDFLEDDLDSGYVRVLQEMSAAGWSDPEIGAKVRELMLGWHELLRPKDRLGYEDHPERDLYLEKVIEVLGGSVVDYDGSRKCCGFPIITMNRETSLTQAGTHIGDAWLCRSGS